MSTVNNQRVVIRRKRSHGHGHHGGSWKIAYADFITAMMAFFLVMWLVSIVPKEELKGIAEYFRMPLHVALTGGPKNSAETKAMCSGIRKYSAMPLCSSFGTMLTSHMTRKKAIMAVMKSA